MPESLDETYERVVKEIKKPNRDHALRLLQCLVVAIRPLHVEELAEVLAVDFDDAEGIPKLKPSWRWEDHEQALLSSCSSLITIVDVDSSRVVQFSHFSVKEYLTSPRLATSNAVVSRYYIDLEPAHTILAQACLSVLLGLDDHVDKEDIRNKALARYAARYWVSHAQLGNASSHLRKAMEYLFDPDKSHFVRWLRIHDIDRFPPSGSTFFLSMAWDKHGAAPLYYAALCGFHDLTEYLIIKHPQQVNADGGYYLRPLVAALAGEHFRTAELLHRNGADPNVQGDVKRTPLHSAAYYGHLKVVQKLIEYGADTNAQDEEGYTPLYVASEGIQLTGGNPNVIRLLLECGVDVNAAAAADRSTPLHEASHWGAVEVARILLEHGADIQAEDDKGKTPLRVAEEQKHNKLINLLLEYGAK
jgi:hypothetical protein